jgi:SAM-dependent methyltransferase
VKLRSLRRHWDALGRQDPLWAVLADPGKKNHRWNPEEFFASGRTEAACVLKYLAQLRINLDRRRALDFGCGVGRVTQALAEHFEEAIGVDIAPSMIAQARLHNRQGELCRFVLNETDDLRAFQTASFDFIYSNIVLQHVKPRYVRRYLHEFVRLLAPSGVAVFQLPSHRLVRPSRVGRLAWLPEPVWQGWRRFRLLFDFPRMDIHGIPKTDVIAHVERSGGRVIDVVPDTSTGPTWSGFRYCIARRPPGA